MSEMTPITMSRFSNGSLTLSRNLFVTLMLLILSLQALALSVSPSATNSGTYTITSTASSYTGPFILFEEKVGSGAWTFLNAANAGGSYSFSNKAVGTYQYRIADCQWGGACSYDGPVTVNVVPPTPGVPSSITVPGTDSNGAFTVSWGAASGTVTSYKLEYKKNSGSWTQIYSGAGISKSVSGLGDGSYQYRIKACNGSACSGYRSSGNTIVANVPGVPVSISAPVNDNNGAFTISWNASSGTVDAYHLEQRINSGSWVQIYTGSATSFAVSGLADASYSFRVRARNSYSTYTTYSAYRTAGTTVVANAPGTPASINTPATDNDGTFIVSWGASSGTVDHYQLFQKNGSGSWVSIFSGTGLSKSISALAPGSYQYRVRACNTQATYTACSGYRTNSSVVVPGDSDSDGVIDTLDAFPNDPNEWADSDGDGVGDNGDAFPNDPNESIDADGDGRGDNEFPPPVFSTPAIDPSGDLAPGNTYYGNVTGKEGVGKDGSFNYTIPIDVPPGINGMAPQLSFNYNSNGGDGVMGVRWSLGGESKITRCKTSLVRDATVTPVGSALQQIGDIGRYSNQVNLNGLDKAFCLDGQRLVAISGVYGANGAEYRTESESFTRIVSNGSLGGGPQSFTVYRKDGQVMQYGVSANARLTANQGAGYSWSRDSISDPVGNQVIFTYALTSGEQTLVRVDYTKNGSTDLNHSVEFDYGSAYRPDPVMGFVGDAGRNIFHRLNAVRVKAAGTLVRKYIIHYESNTNDLLNTSRVSSIDLCFNESQTQCADPASFTWSPYVASFFDTVDYDVSGFFLLNLRHADINGDGLTDIIHTHNDITVRLSNGDGTFQPSQTWMTQAQLDAIGLGTYKILVGDFTADGMADVMLRKSLAVTQSTNGFGGYYLLKSTGTGFDPVQLYFAATAVDHNQGEPLFYDLNGDSLLDAWSTYGITNNEYVSLNTGAGFTDRSLWVSSSELNNIVRRFTDINGDGLPDMIKTSNDLNLEGIKVAYNQGDGQSFTDFFTLQTITNEYHYNVSEFADVNGDGLKDHVFRYSRGEAPDGIWVSVNTGNGFLTPERWIDDYDDCSGCLFEITPLPFSPSTYGRVKLVDVNSDGKSDVVALGSDGLYVSLSTGVSPGQSGVAQTGFLPRQRWLALAPELTQEYVSLLGDVNGDGFIDFFHSTMLSSDIYVLLNKTPTQHINLIHDSGGRNITIDYRPLSNSNGSYTKGQSSPGVFSTMADEIEQGIDANAFSLRVANARHVVAEYAVSNGVGTDVNNFRYHYTGLLHHLSGWGSLGFESIRRDRLVGGTVISREISDYSQHANGAYNLSGKLLKKTTQVSDASNILQPFSETTNHWKVKAYDDDTDSSGHDSPHFFAYLDRSTSYFDDLNGAGQYAESRYSLTSTDSLPSACEARGQVPTVAAGIAAAFDSYGGLERSAEIRCDITGNYLSYTDRVYQNITTTPQWILNLVTSEATTKTSAYDADDRTYSFSYNGLGQLVKRRIEPGHATLQLTADYSYNPYGSISSVTESWPNVSNGMNGVTSRVSTFTESFSSNAERRVIIVDPLLHTTDEVYEAAYGQLKTRTDANNVVEQYSYDILGRLLTESISAAGLTPITTQMNYRRCESTGSCNGDTITNAHTFSYSKTDGQAPVRVFYDFLGREVGNRSTGFNGSAIYSTVEYDAQGRVRRVSEPFSNIPLNWTTSSYDNLDRVVSVLYPDNSAESIVYDGLTVTYTNDLNQSHARHSNALGQIMQTVDAESTVVDYSYDAFDNLLTTQVDNNSSTLTTITYDDLGNRVSLDDPNTGLRQYGVNALGWVYLETDALSQVTATTYDVTGRITDRHEHAASATNHWTYDTAPSGKGLLASVSGIDTLGRTYAETYAYNKLGQVAQIDTSINGATFTVEHDYDIYSRPTGTRYPTGIDPFMVQRGYNAHGHHETLYDAFTGITYWQATAADLRGNITHTTLGDGLLTTERSFNPVTGRPTSITADNNNSVRLQELGYVFDTLGNLKERSDVIAGTTEYFCYDDLNRLTHQSVGASCAAGINNHFAYDSLGNLTNKAGVGSYSYGANGAGPHAITGVSGNQSATYNYDANGNMINGAGRTVTYSVFGKPVHMSRTHSVDIVYNPGRARIEREDSHSNSTTTYVRGLFEKVVAPAQTDYKYYIGDTAIRTQTDLGGGTTSSTTDYQLLDHLGSVVAQVTGNDGSVVEDLAYSAWGERLTGVAGSLPVDDNYIPLVAPHGYTEHEHLDGVGLIHMSGRVYDPALGRFLSPDIYIQAPMSSQSFNRYSYVLNNPLSLTDPSGYWWKCSDNPMCKVVFDASAGKLGFDVSRIGFDNYIQVGDGFYRLDDIKDDPGAYGFSSGGLFTSSFSSEGQLLSVSYSTKFNAGRTFEGGTQVAAIPVAGLAAAWLVGATTAYVASQNEQVQDATENVVNGLIENLSTTATPPPDPNNGDKDDGVKLTGGGKKKIGNLKNLKDVKASDAIKQRGGGAGQVNQLETGYGNKTVGELANSAAQGDRAAETAIKIIKQAGSKAQKYGGK